MFQFSKLSSAPDARRASSRPEAAKRRFYLSSVSIFALALAAQSIPSPASAQTWNGGPGAWGTAGNWNSPATVPNAVGATATFGNPFASTIYPVSLSGGPYTIGTLNLTGPQNVGGYTFGGGTLIMQVAAGSAQINVQTNAGVADFGFSAPVTLQLNSNTVANTSSGATLGFTSQASITGLGGLTFTGAGTTTFAGANSYSGGTTVASGFLTLSGAGTLGATTGVLAVTGGTLNLGGTTQTQDGGVTVSGGGTIHDGVLISALGITSFAGAIGNVSGTNVTVTGGTTLFYGSNSFGAVTINAGATLINNGVTADDLNNSGIVVNNSIYNANIASNTGTITNSVGANWVGNVNAGANVAGGLITNQGTWTGTGNNAGGTIDNQATWTGSIVNTTGTFTNSGTVSAGVTNAATFNNNAGGAVTGGVINNAGGVTYNYAGATIDTATVNGGTLVNSGGAITGPVTNNAGGTFFNNASGTVGGLLTNSGLANNNAALDAGVSNSGTFNNNSGATVVGGLTNNAGGASTNNFGGTIDNATVNAGSLSNSGLITGTVTNVAAFFNNATGIVNGHLNNSGTTNNSNQLNGGVDNSGTFNNNAAGVVVGGLTNLFGGASTNFAGGTIDTATVNAGSLSNSGAITGGVTNAGTFFNNGTGTVGGLLSNSGTANNSNQLNGGVLNSGTFNNNAGGVVLGGLDNLPGGVSTNFAGASIDAATVDGGTLSNSGAITGAVINFAAFFNNAAGVVGGLLTNAGTANNSNLLIGGVVNSGTFNNNAGGVVVGVGLINNAGGLSTNFAGGTILTATVNGGTLSNSGAITGAVTNAGAFFNNSTGTVGGLLTNSGSANNNNQLNAGVLNSGTFNNNATGVVVGGLTNAGGLATNFAGGTIDTASINAGTLSNSGAITGAVTVTNGATFFNNPTGVLNSGLTNTGTFNAQGTLNGAINNNAGNFNVTGNFNGNGVFTNALGANLNVNAGTYTNTAAGPGAITNNGAINVANGATLSALAGVTNNVTGTITVALGGTVNDALNNAGTVTNSGTYNANVATNTGTITNTTTGIWNGNVASSTGTINSSNIWNGNIANSGILNGTGTISGAVNNAAGASLNVVAPGQIGALTVGSLANQGAISLPNASSNNKLVVQNGYAGGGSIYISSLLNARSSSQLIIQGGPVSGATTLFINTNNTTVAYHADTPVVTGGAGGTFTVANAFATTSPSPFAIPGAQLIAAPSGILQEWLGQATPGNYVQRVVVNASAVGNLMGSVSGMLSTLNEVFTEPASAFITGPHDPKPDTFSMGAWVRTRAAGFTTKTASVVQSQGLGAAAQSVSATTNSSISGFHGGFDFGLYNIANTNWNANLGLHGGTVSGSSSSGPTSMTLEAPFYGLYGALTNGVYSFDVLVRRDLYMMNVYSSQGLIANNSNSDRGNGWSGIVNGQYHYNIGETGWYAEPSLAFLWSNAQVNPLAVNAPGSTGNNAIQWNNFESATGRAGLRVGTAFQATSDLIVAPYSTLSVWHEFAGNSFSSLNLTTGSDSTNVTVSTNRIGTFGQFGLGSAFSSPLPGLSGFVRGDVRFGQRMSGEAINAGLRWQF
ncbi:hypothetical protein [uncultured Rhodoblastus sp.]|uniref:beta strand repeat-containing protein n=1 Tax=uncultured Rhodoblastus sp. TaxID=543037 RepID=UPI0025F44E08|nr:hypothetical protein [uncultured Rhodoblastus sp.]